MPGITTYPLSPTAGFAGQIADEAPRYVTASGINKEAAALQFGLAVKKGTNEDEILLPTAAGDLIAGISVHRHDVNTIGATSWLSDAGIPVGDRADILRKGVIFVKVEEAVVQGDKAYSRFQPGTAAGAVNDQKGAWRKSADTLVAWAISTAYTVGQRRVNGGNLYEVITAGTSAGSGGPSGTGSDITDGTVHWKYVAAAATGASARAMNGAYYLKGAASGGIAPLYFNFSTANG